MGFYYPSLMDGKIIKRICGSTMEPETIALVEGMGHGVYMRVLIEEICGLQEKTMPIELLVDNKRTCTAVRGHCSVSDKRLKKGRMFSRHRDEHE